MIERVMVPLDGSPLSDRALEFGFALARGNKRALHCVHVVDTQRAIAQAAGSPYPFDPTPLIDVLRTQGETILAAAAMKASAAGITATTHLLFEDRVLGMIAKARELRVDLVVMGTHGRSGLARFFIGSTTEGVLRSCEIPVLAVTAGTGAPEHPFGRALVALDDSDPADAAREFAFELAREEQSHLVFCAVAETTAAFARAVGYASNLDPVLDDLRAATRAIVDDAAKRAQELAIPCESLVVDGEPVAELLDSARRVHADLTIIGSHGRRGIQRMFFGSVAEGVVRQSTMPVLVVRAPHTPAT